MYFSGFVQSLMWKQFTPEGTLQYGNFLETTIQLLPMHMLRAIGGAMYLAGAIIMTVNLYRTAAKGKFLANEAASAPGLPKEVVQRGWHHALESKPVLFTILATVAVLIGGLVELVPTFLIKSNVPTISAVKPYTPLELAGRDIYIREGCVNCHSQMVRPFRSETERYGEYSKAGEFVYDHPFLWGSKRTGPDLHRVGGKYPDSWHYQHMADPTSMSPNSVMPSYPWLLEAQTDAAAIPAKVAAMKTLGVPYPNESDAAVLARVHKQENQIVKNLADASIKTAPDKEIVALIAYLQRLGMDIKNAAPDETEGTSDAVANR
jgi:cytochrome c oxidase cbb3-type subunit I/II